MLDEVSAIRAVVRGRVQGVGFREYVETRARVLRLTGYVRNLPDRRSVEVVAEGPRERLTQLIEHLHDGPRMSRVDAVDVEWTHATGEYRGFRTEF
jgi:acylphosphatase